MTRHASSSQIPLPRGWSRHVKSAVLHVISLASFARAAARGWAVNSPIARRRLQAENDRLREEVALLAEENRIKDARMKRIPPQNRPHYAPPERMSIIEVRAARGWSAEQTAGRFHVTGATIASWMQRLNEEGCDALVQIREPVNKFPAFVRYAVQRLKSLCPTLGKVKIAEMLCRAGLHLGTTTISRILKEKPNPKPDRVTEPTNRVVTAKAPDHVWHIDLTTVPTGGLWAPWLPFSLPQCWPFCWWLAVVVDHFSRRAIAFAIFSKRPTSQAVRRFLGQLIARCKAKPKYVISDKDKIFWCDGFKRWCGRKGIRPRYGAAGQHGSIAVVERFIRTLKDDGLRRILVSQRQACVDEEVRSFFDWHNEHRPHTTLDGRTPNEVYFGLTPANQRPRIEPRKQWPRGSPCAEPHTLVAGQPGDRFALKIDFLNDKRHLPIISLRRAA